MEEIKKTKEIDLLGLAIKVLHEWKLLLRFVFIAAIFGVIIALSTPKTYKSEVVLAPELSSGGLGLTDNLADMASNFGIDLGTKSSMDAIYPELYPDIFNSSDFVMGLFNVPVRLKNDDTPRTYIHHLTKEWKVPFWNYPRIWLAELLKPKDTNSVKGGAVDPYKISRIEDDLCNSIRNVILCSIDKKTSIITINVTDQDPMVAAIMADTLQKRLQEYITDYRTSKARTDYEYYLKLLEEAKQDYEKALNAYAKSSDSNMDLVMTYQKTKIEDLENHMQLKFNTYTALNTQLQTAKAKVQERTPAFTIIQKPIMPYKPSSTPRAFIVFIFMFLGGMADAAWVLYLRDFYHKKKK